MPEAANRITLGRKIVPQCILASKCLKPFFSMQKDAPFGPLFQAFHHSFSP